MKRDTTVQQETAEISMLVSSISKYPTLSVPADYFNSLTEQIVGQTTNADNQENDSNVLHLNATKNKTISLPVNYFDSFNNKLMARIHEQESSPKIISLKRYRIAIAAAVIGLLGFFIAIKSIRSNETGNIDNEMNESISMSKLILQQKNMEQAFNLLEDEDIINFLNDNGHDVNAALLASLDETNNINLVNDYFCEDEKLNQLMSALKITEKQ